MDSQRVDHYKKQFTFFNTRASLDKSYWLIAHKQFWNHKEQEKYSGLGVDPHSVINENLLHAFKDTPIKNISAITSGHIHMAQVLFMNDAPTQIISGNGGGIII